jgi:ABC-type glycerol-3-phosphate transport system substrate-binding protein
MFRKNTPLILALFWVSSLILVSCSAPPTGLPEAELSPSLPPPQVTQRSQTEVPDPEIPTPAPPPATSGIDVVEADLSGVTLSFWHVWSWETGDRLERLVDTFNAVNEFGIRVETVKQDGYGELNRALSGALATEALPHLIVGFPNQLRLWESEDQILVDLQAYINDPIWGYTESEQADFYPRMWAQDIADEKRLGLPAQRSLQFLFYNRTWADELGFETPPETLEEFTTQACAAAGEYFNDEDQSNDGLGGWTIDTSTATVLGWFRAFGGEYDFPDGYRFGSEQNTLALGYLKSLFDRGCAWLAASRYPNEEFATRKALFINTSIAGIPYQEEAFSLAGSEDNWTSIPFPGENGESITILFGPSYAIVESDEVEQLATWLFLKWLLEPNNQAQWVEVSGHLPSRISALDSLAVYQASHPQWAAAAALISTAYAEPQHASWGTVRWTVSDAAEQVFRLGLTEEQVPALLEELDLTAAELHASYR